MTGIAEVALVNFPIGKPIQGTNYVNGSLTIHVATTLSGFTTNVFILYIARPFLTTQIESSGYNQIVSSSRNHIFLKTKIRSCALLLINFNCYAKNELTS